MTRDEILTSLRERILAFATSRVSREVAEDLTQEVLVLLHEKYARVTELTELVPLAFQVLRFKMLDAHRKSLRRANTIRNRSMSCRWPIPVTIRRHYWIRSSVSIDC